MEAISCLELEMVKKWYDAPEERVVILRWATRSESPIADSFI